MDEIRKGLDEIKGFAAGITSARRKSTDYKIASYYDYMFAFHQFFHSSYRARQGQVLERILSYILKTYCNCDIVPSTPKKRLNILKDIYNIEKIKNLDIDSLGIISNEKKALVIQVRSRDDTGGTTAKGSLVDLTKVLLEIDKTPSHEILYLIIVWVPGNSQQKKSAIRKIFLSLKNLIKIDEEELIDKISSGIIVKENVKLQLVYGIEELSDVLEKWGKSAVKIRATLENLIKKIENWDDLWVAYALGNLEFENNIMNKMNNLHLLSQKLRQNQLKLNFKSYDELINSINDISGKLLTLWKEDSLPVKSPFEISHYIRDLLFLRAIYEKLIKRKEVVKIRINEKPTTLKFVSNLNDF